MRTRVTQSFSYALDPTPFSAAGFSSHSGGSRYAYNHLLHLVSENWAANRARKEAGEEVPGKDYLGTSHFDLLGLWSRVRDEVAPWWGENGAGAYNDAAQRLSRAFANWRAGRARFPRYRRKSEIPSIRFTNTQVQIIDRHHIRISRIGVVKTFESIRKLARHIERGTGRVLAGTVKFKQGRWFIVFTAEIEREVPEKRAPERVLGIDLGIRALYTGATPEGEHVLDVPNPRGYQQAEHKLARAQRAASRKQGPLKGQAPSNRWRKANKRVQKLHTGVASRRVNLIHEVTTMLAKTYGVIVMEDLHSAGMLRNRKLAKHLSDAAFGEFRRQLEYKTAWYGSTLVLADRFYPSSKTCSGCGAVKAKLSLSEREFHCETCGLRIDRDLNAAINLARKGPSGTHSVAGRGGKQKTRTASAALAAPSEASTEHALPGAHK